MTTSPSIASDNQPTEAVNTAILAPVSAFPHGIPQNALVVVPLGPNASSVEQEIAKGPFAVTLEQAWKLLGFNGPPVPVQDDQGRPVAIGLEDLLQSLEQHWAEDKGDLPRGRFYAQELIKYGRHERAEQVLAHVVAQGGEGEDWLALGVSQLQQQKLDKAEATLRGAQNLLKSSPVPSLHLAQLARTRNLEALERQHFERALQIDPGFLDTWSLFAAMVTHYEGREAALRAVEELAEAPVHLHNPTPYIALHTLYAAEESTRDVAISFAQKALARSPQDPMALLCLSGLYGQTGRLQEAVDLLTPHETLIEKNVQLAHNYAEVLFQLQQWNLLIPFLNKLQTSSDPAMKQLATERGQRLAQYAAQQQTSATS